MEYRAFPSLAKTVDRAQLRERQATFHRFGEKCGALGLRFGLWDHEVMGPKGLLDLLPELRASDGLIDLENPLLYDLIREKCGEFLDLFPWVNEIVLTLTETEYVVAQRPFSKTPPAERIRRVLQAVADATEPRGRTLVIRPFSAVRADELFVRDAVGSLKAARVAMMYKTEPFDWNPFLPNEELIGSVPRYEVRTETDGGAEYYGQADFPCCYARFIAWRLEAALAKGATVVALRVDRGSGHNALGHPLNEVNVIAPTRWLLDSRKSLPDCWAGWMRERHGNAPAGTEDLLEQTFEVIKKALYVDGQMLSHRAFSTFEGAKHVLAFALLQEEMTLEHLSEHWSMSADSGQQTPTHAAWLREKEDALALARDIRRGFDAMAAGLKPGAREAIAKSLDCLILVVEAWRALSRVMIAHAEEMTEGKARSTESFAEEALRMDALADEVERLHGAAFHRGMPAAMRGITRGLATEQAMERPLRATLRGRKGLVDFVLCGFATEMHRIAKRLHTGGTPCVGDRMARGTGLGPNEGFSYLMRCESNKAHRVVLRVAGPSGAGVLEAVGQRFEMPAAPGDSPAEITFDLAPAPSATIRVGVWSTATTPCRIAAIELYRIDP